MGLEILPGTRPHRAFWAIVIKDFIICQIGSYGMVKTKVLTSCKEDCLLGEEQIGERKEQRQGDQLDVYCYSSGNKLNIVDP